MFEKIHIDWAREVSEGEEHVFSLIFHLFDYSESNGNHKCDVQQCLRLFLILSRRL